VVVTLHRPSNVDDAERLGAIASALREIAEEHDVVFPAHPRTRQRLEEGGHDLGKVQLFDPVGYTQMLDLVDGASVVITDSGGLQEETTALGVPCVTLRDNTERPITVTEGTNTLAGTDPARIVEVARAVLAAPPAPRRPELWDGRAGARIADVLVAGGSARERKRPTDLV